jgi:hypothetical protein
MTEAEKPVLAAYPFALECNVGPSTSESGCMYDVYSGPRSEVSTDEQLLVPEVILVCRLHGTSFSIAPSSAGLIAEPPVLLTIVTTDTITVTN